MDGNFLYVLCENTPYVYAVDEDGEIVSRVRTSSKEHLFPSAIRVLPERKILIVSNRGADTISFFSLNNGNLEFSDEYPCNGVWPRDFIVTKDERYLIVCNQNSDNVVAYPLDWGNKTILGDCVLSLDIKTPVCCIELI